mgnify:FL=1
MNVLTVGHSHMNRKDFLLLRCHIIHNYKRSHTRTRTLMIGKSMYVSFTMGRFFFSEQLQCLAYKQSNNHYVWYNLFAKYYFFDFQSRH